MDAAEIRLRVLELVERRRLETGAAGVPDVLALAAQYVEWVRTGSSEVLPLHRSPQARYEDAGADYCTLDGCPLFPGVERHFAHGPAPECRCHDSEGNSILVTDPEPHDVGHPDAIDQALADPSPSWSEKLFGDGVTPARLRQLVGCECGHRWGLHDLASGGCTARVAGWGGPAECECTRTPPRPSVGCECGHRWGVHGGGMCHAAQCECTRRTQADVNAGCECGHSWRVHDETGCGRVHGAGSGCTRTPPNAGEVRL